MKKRSAVAAFMIPMALWAQNTVTVQASIKGLSAGVIRAVKRARMC